MRRLVRFIRELRRRKVIRMAGAYLLMAFVTLQVVDVVFPALPLPPGADTLVLVLLAIGFPISLALAWALELTPEGLRKELTADEAEARVPDQPAMAPGKDLRPDSIAVLPFENLSADPENEYFSDGVTEDIIASIARVRGVRVLSRTSVLQFKQVNRPIGEIARELGVATVVTGSVRKSGGRLRIVAQVVDAREDAHLWSETYDRDLEDVFQVQSEVAAQVANAVRRELPAADRIRIQARGTSDPEAYDLYLRARFLWNQRDEGAVAESVEFFRRALERDPSFALAHSGLADAYTVLGIYGARAPNDVCPAAHESADKALAVDPELGEAVASIACVEAVFDWDWETAEKEFVRAVALSPSYATSHQWYAMNLLTPQARFAEAFAALERAHELDPASVAIATSRGIVSFYSKDYESAQREFQVVAALHRQFALVHHFLAQCHQAAGRWTESVASAAEAVKHSRGSSETLAGHGYALARAGRITDAEAVLRQLEERSQRRYVSSALLAQVHVGLGRTEEALDALEEAVAARATDLIWLGVRPLYDPLRGEARFDAIVEAVGLDRG